MNNHIFIGSYHVQVNSGTQPQHSTLTNLVMLYEVGGHARLLNVATLESETSQREEHTQTTTQSWQEVATTNIGE